MTKLKIAIVEDERITALSLEDMVSEIGYEVSGSYISAEKALEGLREEKPDLAMLDVQLKGEETGIWLGQRIKEELKFPFIYLTSFGDDNTIKAASETAPYGYLVKPIAKENLHAAIEVAFSRFSEETQTDDASNPELMPIRDALFIKDEHYYSKILLDEILFIKSDDNYLEIYTQERKHLVRGTLKTLYPRLPTKKFLQVHRSYIVNITSADGFGANFVKIGKESIPVSKGYLDELKGRFQIY